MQPNNQDPVKDDLNNVPDVTPDSTGPTVIQPSTESVSTDAQTDQGQAAADNTDTVGTSPESSSTSDKVSGVTPNASTVGSTQATTPTTTNGAILGSPMTSNNTPASVPSSSGPKKPKKKIVVIGVIVAVLIALLGASAAAYYAVLVPMKEKSIIENAFVNTIDPEKISSSGFEGEISFESGSEVSEVASGVTFEGASSYEGPFTVKVGIETPVAKPQIEVLSEDGKTIFASVSGLEGLSETIGAFSGFGESEADQQGILFVSQIVETVNNQWYSVDESLLKQFLGDAVPTTNAELSKEDILKLDQAYKQNQFLKIDERLDDEDIHGVPSYHAMTTIDSEKLKSFLRAVKDAKIESLPID